MADVAVDHVGVRVSLRACAVILDRERVLIQRLAGGEVWWLPGGRVRVLERARDALARELEEELQERAQVGPLVWVAENFFEDERKRFHEICFFFRARLPEGRSLPAARGSEFEHQDGDVPLVCRWERIDRLAGVALYPRFLRQALGAVPNHTVHVEVYNLGRSLEDTSRRY